MKKKILIAIGQLTGGGAERVATVWANELSEKGYDVSIVTCFPSENEYPIKKIINVHRVAETQNHYLQMSFSKRYIAFRCVLRKVNPDYVISFLLSMQVWIMLAAIGLPVKRIETIRLNPWRVFAPNKLQWLLWKLCYCTCSKIILQSSDQALFFSKRQQKKSVVIPNPISDVYLENYRVGLDGAPKRFIAVGRIDAQKNYPMMIRAFANVCRKNPEITLNIYGAGNDAYIEEISRMISAEGMVNNISLMGRVNHMEQEYRKHDVFLMTSDYEGLPNALAEAMASRLVCISTDCKTGPRDLIDEGQNGFLVPVGNIEALQQKMEEIIAMNLDQLDPIAENARKKVLAYCSRKNSVERVCDLFV